MLMMINIKGANKITLKEAHEAYKKCEPIL